MGWQPIDNNTPHSGVLVSDGYYVEDAFWNNDARVWDSDIKECWTVYEPDDYFFAVHLIESPPTHWMYKPEPPEDV